MMLGMACNLTISNFSLLGRSISCLNTTFSPITIYGEEPPNSYFPFKGAPKILCYIFYGLVFLLGFSGNLMVFYVLGYRKNKRSSNDLFTLSLAFADILSSIFGPAVMLNDLITDNSDWFYGKAMCHVFPGISPASQTASAWSLVFISIDRYRIIASPFGRKPRATGVFCSICFIWLLFGGFALCYGIEASLVGKICQSTNKIIKNPNIFVTFWVSFTWFVPAIFLAVTYILTARALKRNTVPHANSMAVMRRNKQNAEIIKMFVIIVVMFLLSTVPYALFYLIVCFQIANNPNQDYRLITMMNYMLYIPLCANACVNPFVYAKMHREINRHVRSKLLDFYHSLCCKMNFREKKSQMVAHSNLSTEETNF